MIDLEEHGSRLRPFEYNKRKGAADQNLTIFQRISAILDLLHVSGKSPHNEAYTLVNRCIESENGLLYGHGSKNCEHGAFSDEGGGSKLTPLQLLGQKLTEV